MAFVPKRDLLGVGIAIQLDRYAAIAGEKSAVARRNAAKAAPRNNVSPDSFPPRHR
jgi:hypothetical protein